MFRKLHESEARFRQTLATAPNAIVIVNGQGRITDWNHAAQKMFQYSEEEAVGQTMHQLIAPPRYRDDAARGFAHFEEAGSGPLIGKVTEISALRKDGNEFPAEVSISAVRLQGSWHAIGIIHDITERKRTEDLISAQHAEIERARLDWKAVFDSISQPIFLHDGEFRVIRANRAYAEQAGKPFNEIIGQPYYTLFPKSDTPLPCCLRAMEKAEEEEEVAVGEAIFRSRTFSVRSERGVYLYSVHILEDITARKRIEQALRENEERYRTMIENSNDLIWVIAPDRKFTFANQQAAEAIGYAIDDWMGKPFELLVLEEDLPMVLEIHGKAMRGEKVHYEVRSKKADGGILALSVNASPILKGGKVVGTISFATDITERKHLEERTAALLKLSTSTGTQDEKTLLQQGLDTAQHLTDSRIGFLHFVSEDQNEIELVTWSSDTLAHFCRAKFDRHYPVSEAGIWADCIHLKQSIIINDYAASPDKKGYPEGHADVQRFISVPILDGNLVRMIVGVGNANKDYDEHDVETVRLFGYDLYRIIQHKRTEDMLRESEERFYQLFKNMSSGVAVYQPDSACEVFTINSVNKAAERIDQVRREDVAGRNVEEVFPGVRTFGLLEVFKRVCRSGSSERFPPAFYQDGRISGWRDNYVYRLKSGEVVAVYNDVTERMQAEEEMRLREQFLDCTTDSVFVNDFDGNFVYLNEAAWKTRGYTWNELMAMNLHALDVPGYEKLIDARIREPLEKGHRIFESAHRRKDGSVMPIEVSARIIESSGRKLVLAAARDISERKQAEQKRQEAVALIKDALEDAIGAVAATLEQRDPYTAGHQRRVAQLAVAIAEEMGLAREVIEGIRFGGMIHDLGKISVPAEILGKPGRLTDIELGLIQTHAEAGYQIVKDIAFPWPVADMVRQHHERLDGSGYPQGLKSEQIVLEARILAVADTVEAMSANRPYRPGFGVDAALDEITRCRGTQLDAMAVDACLRAIREKGFVFTQ